MEGFTIGAASRPDRKVCLCAIWGWIVFVVRVGVNLLWQGKGCDHHSGRQRAPSSQHLARLWVCCNASRRTQSRVSVVSPRQAVQAYSLYGQELRPPSLFTATYPSHYHHTQASLLPPSRAWTSSIAQPLAHQWPVQDFSPWPPSSSSSSSSFSPSPPRPSNWRGPRCSPPPPPPTPTPAAGPGAGIVEASNPPK